MLPAVRTALSSALEEADHQLLNPSSVHRHGQKSKAMMAKLRASLGAWAGRADGDEWVFTSGATESINTILRGFCAHRKLEGRKPCIFTSKAEHSAVLETLEYSGAEVKELVDIDTHGQLDFQRLEALLIDALSKPETDVLISLNLLNNETGVLLDFDELGKVLGRVREKFEDAQIVSGSKRFHVENNSHRIWIHFDAAQALGKLEPRLLRMAWYLADYVSLSAHKMGAASGIGALWLRPQVPFTPFMTGGVQEKKRRAGTFNSLAAFTWISALEDWRVNGDEYRNQMKQLRERLHARLLKIDGYQVHGLTREGQLPAAVNTLNFHIRDCDEESLVMALDVEGFSVSSGSACNSGSLKPSHVLLAMGYSSSIALSSVRLSLGAQSTLDEVDAFAECLEAIVRRIRDGKSYWAGVLPEVRPTL
jgi:cysteine desulfurase